MLQDTNSHLQTCVFFLSKQTIWIRGFHDKIKLYILRQNLHQTCFNDSENVKWRMKQTSNFRKVCEVAEVASVAYSTLDPVMVSVVGSIPSGGNFLLKLFETPLKI